MAKDYMKLNIGCGSNRIQGWENRDIDCDLTKLPLPYKDGSVEFILGEHIWEHLSAPDGFRLMEDCHRILAPGGILRICVPHLDRITDIAHCRDLIVSHGHLVVFNLANLCTMLQIAGFDTVSETERKDCDGHWRVIGEAKDSLETLRVEARKAA